MYLSFQGARYTADLAWSVGDTEKALRCFNEMIATAKIDVFKITPYAGLAKIYLEQGNWAQAAGYLAESIVLQLANPIHVTFEDLFFLVEFTAILALSQGRAETAVRLLAAANRSYQFNHLTFPPPQRLMVDQAYATARNSLDATAFTTAWETGLAMTLNQALELALTTVK